MPLYFFHLSGPHGCSRDEVGLEFPNAEAAYLGAHEAAFEISFDLLRRQADPSRHWFEIVDQGGQMLFELPFSEALQTSRPAPPPALHARVNQQQQRAVRAASELKQSVQRTRSLLATTRSLLRRA